MSRRFLSLLAPALATGALAAPASAATVSQISFDSCNGDVACSKYGGGHPVPVTRRWPRPRVRRTASPSRATARSSLVADAGAPLLAQAPCTQVDAATARCPFTAGEGGIAGLRIDVGDGDDEVAITGDPGAASVLAGGPGVDAISGGDGNDTIDGGPGGDRLAGGGGSNTLTYAGRKADVTVDLRAGSGGASGETDALSGFTALIGGDRTDILLGSRANESLDGGPGADNLEGRGGADDLYGSLGPDALRGGPGNDHLFGDPEQGDDYYTPRSASPTTSSRVARATTCSSTRAGATRSSAAPAATRSTAAPVATA